MRYLPDTQLPSAPRRRGEPRPPGVEAVRLPFPKEHFFLVTPYLHGLDLFAGGFYWEAHEVWEDLWRSCDDDRARETLQALIQVAAAHYHLASDNRSGAETLARRAADHLARAAPGLCLGIDLEDLTGRLRAAARGGDLPELALSLRSRDLPATATDLWVLPEGARRGGDEASVWWSTPAFAAFDGGHAIALHQRPAATDVPAWLDACAERLGAGGAARQSIVWEELGDHDRRELGPPGCSCVRHGSWVHRGAPPRAESSELQIEVVRDAGDWDAVVDMSIEIGRELSGDDCADFVRWRYGELRRDADRGRAEVWIARLRGRAVASLGVFGAEHAARFQEVQVRASHRRRGIGTELVARTTARLRSRLPHASIVIVAETESQAERIYRRLGFARVSTQHWIARGP